MRNYSAQNPLLLTPGPVMVCDEVLDELSKPVIPHRSKEFSEILKRVYSNLKYVFQTKNDIFIFPSSGTGAMCGALENLINPRDKVLSLVCGVFGNRWTEIAKNRNAEVHIIEVPYGKTITADIAEDFLAKNKDTKIVTLTHCETSTGALNNIKSICSVIKKYGAISVVDGVSSVGSCECKQDEWGIDVLVSASQKGLGCPPGLGFLSANNRAWDLYKQCQTPSYYFNWDYYKKSVENNSVPCTPAISLIHALDRALDIIKKEGIGNLTARRENYSQTLYHGLTDLGLEPLTLEPDTSPAVVAVKSEKSEEIREVMKKDFHIILAGGQSDLYSKIFRIGTLGDITEDDIDYTLNCLAKILKKI